MTNEVAQSAVLKPKRKVSMIWLLPLITFLIGAGLVFHAWQNRGIQIKVEFESAEGIEANKTKVRYRSVDVGQVKSVGFTEDNRSVIANIEIDRDMVNLLSSDSEFWVVRPRVGSGGVSGISTIFSGSYIQLEPGKAVARSRRFVGLETPSLTAPTSNGIHLTLIAANGDASAVGNPVMYRGYKVGVVESSKFDQVTRKVNYGIFVKAPYDSLVTTNTVFWHAGGVSVSASTNGVTLDLPSMESLLTGGIEFDVIEQEALGEPIRSGAEFTLYKNKAEVLAQRHYAYLKYILLVDDTIDGLYKGAPVEYRGIRIGTVAQPYLDFSEIQKIDAQEDRIPVLLHIEPERLYRGQEFKMKAFAARFNSWILGGLTAKPEMANLLTGSLQISLSPSTQSPEHIEYFGEYPVIPTAKSQLANMTRKVDTILDKVGQLPIEQSFAQLDNTFTQLDKTFAQLDKTLVSAQLSFAEVNTTLKEMQISLKGVQPDSPLYLSIDESMLQLQKALKSIQPVLAEINKRPNALIFSGAAKQDVEPKGNNNE